MVFTSLKAYVKERRETREIGQGVLASTCFFERIVCPTKKEKEKQFCICEAQISHLIGRVNLAFSLFL